MMQTKVNKHSSPAKTSKACLIYGSLGQPMAVSKWKGFCLVPNLNPNRMQIKLSIHLRQFLDPFAGPLRCWLKH